MASISAVGPSSGIDVNQVMAQQLNVEKQSVEPRLPQTDANTDTVQAKLSTQGKLQSSLSDYMGAAQMLASSSTWTNPATTTTSSDPSSVSAVSDGSAAAGAYRVEVNSLAAAQTTTSASFTGLGTVIGLGTLHIELGGWNSSQTAFSTNPNWPKSDVMIGPHDNSLERIRDKINAAGVGVVASVISDATGSRLVLRSTSTGKDNGFKVSATEDGAASQSVQSQSAGLAALGFDPSALAGAPSAAPPTVQTQAAADAVGKINGVEVQSPTNTLADAVDGLTFKFSKVTEAPVNVSVAPDKEAIKKSVTDFTKAYNELNALGQAPTGLNRALSSIGISTDANGSLGINDAKLDKALAQRPDQVQKVFATASQQVQSRQTDDNEAQHRRVGTADPPAPSFASKLLDQYRALEPGTQAANSAPDYLAQ